MYSKLKMLCSGQRELRTVHGWHKENEVSFDSELHSDESDSCTGNNGIGGSHDMPTKMGLKSESDRKRKKISEYLKVDDCIRVRD